MALLIGQSGSMLRSDYVQPPVIRGNNNADIVSKGAFLQSGGAYTSLSPDDASRFRPTSFVAPTQIDLMQGFMDTPFYSNNPFMSDTRVLPYDTFVNQRPPSSPSQLSLASGGGGRAAAAPFLTAGSAGNSYSFQTTPSSSSSNGGSMLLRGARGSGGGGVSAGPYGQTIEAPSGLSSRNCPAPQKCYVNVSGACACSSSSPLYNPASSNIYY